jgi:protein dopey-1-like protein (fragment)
MPININCEEKELLNDPKYRIFAQQIDKALKAFEGTSRWPDLVYALSRLIKVNIIKLWLHHFNI